MPNQTEQNRTAPNRTERWEYQAISNRIIIAHLISVIIAYLHNFWRPMRCNAIWARETQGKREKERARAREFVILAVRNFKVEIELFEILQTICEITREFKANGGSLRKHEMKEKKKHSNNAALKLKWCGQKSHLIKFNDVIFVCFNIQINIYIKIIFEPQPRKRVKGNGASWEHGTKIDWEFDHRRLP